MKNGFDEAFEFLMIEEGGYVNDPKDCGGETKYGICKRSYPELDIPSLTKEKAKDIYKKDYWDACKCEDLPRPFDILVFDTAVNMGNIPAIKILQKTFSVKVDGIIGPETLKAAQSKRKGTKTRFMLYRLLEYTEKCNWENYKRGWFNRLLHYAERV